MFGPNMNSGLSLTKILGGINKVLGIANNAIPIYKEIKPMASNARKIIQVLREFKQDDGKVISKPIKQLSTKKDVIPIHQSTTSLPTFFQ